MSRNAAAPHVDGPTLAAARTRAGLTQEQLAVLAGVAQQRVSEWETGRYRPSRATLDRIAAAVGVSPSSLLRELVTLADLRTAAGLTQDQVAAAVGISQRTYSRIETGDRGAETDLQARLARVLGASRRRVAAACEATRRG